MKKLIMSAVLLASSFVFAGPVSSSLLEAQEAYRHNNASKVVLKLKEALMEHNNHPVVAAQATRMLSKLAKSGALNNIDVGWSLPKEVDHMQIEIRRRYNQDNGRVRFNIVAQAQFDKGHSIEEFQLIRYPNSVVIDKKGKIGEWADEVWDGFPAFWSGSDKVSQTIEEGLYLINFKLAGQNMVNGWVILQDINASSAPVVEKPILNQEFKTSTPTFNWRKYVSAEYKPSETRNLRLYVTQESATDFKEIFTANFGSQANIVKYTVGDIKTPKYFEGDSSPLASGAYMMSLRYFERSMFGPVMISRSSQTSVPFSIK